MIVDMTKIFQEVLNLSEPPELCQKFRDFEQWDSLAFLSLNLIIEEKYGLEMSREEFLEMETLEDILTYILANK